MGPPSFSLFYIRATRPSPDELDTIILEGFVASEDGERFREGLGDEETVEGVAVVVGERFELKDVRVADGKEGHAEGEHSAAEVGDGGARRVWCSDVVLAGD